VDIFVDACGEEKGIDTVSRLIEGGVDINGRKSRGGYTGLMVAMCRNNVAIVRKLLASESVNLAMRDSYEITALHWGCCQGSVESVRLFLAHPKCTQEIVGMVDNRGFTAEMVATLHGGGSQEFGRECGRLVREYLDANVETAGAEAASASPPQESALSPGQLEEALAIVEREEAERKRRKEALKEALAKEEREEAELKSRKDALLMERARSQSSIVPECPVCLVKMAPPLQIFTCSNGHLICNLCKPRISGNLCVTRCQGSYTGRATAVEQIVRYTLGIE